MPVQNSFHPVHGTLADTVFENHKFRKIYHLLGGMMLIVGLAMIGKYWFSVFGCIYLIAFKLYARRISFAMIGILLLLMLSGSVLITLSTMVIWVIGDGLAGMIGARFGKIAWPWHPQKTILGSAAFFTSSALAQLIFLTLILKDLPHVLLLLSVIPAFVACIVETLPITIIKDRKADDNLLVILTTGLLIQVMVVLFGVGVRF